MTALYDAVVETVVEVGGWEHECCGPSFEREAVVQLDCLVIPGSDRDRLVETHHDLETSHQLVTVQGRVVDIAIQHPDGSVEQLRRLPSGRALRGFDEVDDGHLERAWTGEPVVTDSDEFILTIAGSSSTK